MSKETTIEETTPLAPHGTVTPTGLSWLEEVKLDAARNAVAQVRRQQEAQAFNKAKANGITTEDIEAEAKKGTK